MKKITLTLFAFLALTYSWHVNAQLEEGFEAGFVSLTNQSGNNLDWTISSTLFSEGSQSARNAHSSSQTNILISAALDISTMTSPLLYFDHIAKTEGGWDFCYVEVSTDGSTWVTLETYDEDSYPDWGTSSTTPTNTWWKSEVFDISSYISATTYVRFRLTSDSSTNRYGWLLDNVRIAETPSCLEPDNMTTSNLTAVSADLTWSAGTSGESAWNLEWKAGIDFTPGNAEEDNSDSVSGTATYSVASLLPNTAYYVYYQADCGGGDVSAWVGPFIFNTLCTAFDIPFTEGFNSDSTTQNCWTVLNENGDADAWNMDYTLNSFEGDQSASILTDYNSGDNDDWLISPPIALTGNERLKFKYRVAGSSEPNDFELLLSSTGIDPADFTSTLLANTSYSNTSYEEKIIDLSSYSGNVYVAWHIPNNGLDGWRLYIDEVVFETLPSCVEPNGLSAIATSATEATVTWTAGGAETDWTYEYGLTGFTQGSGTTATVSTTPSLDLNNLTPGETYDIYVQTNCSGSDSVFITTTWSQPNVGETCDAPIVITSLPYNTSDDTANYGDDYSGSPGDSGCGTTSSYLNGDDVVYAYTATSDTSINVALSSIGDTYSGVFVYADCADIGTACVAGFGNGWSTSNYDFDVVLSGGTTYYIIISTYASPQSTTYTLDITENTCTNPTVDFTVVSDCDNSGGFMIEADITDLGSATSLTVSDDQGSTNQSASVTGVVSFGPYTNGTDVTLTITNEQDGTCFVSSDALTQSVCPPDNDECISAIELIVEGEIADLASATQIPGTIAGATDSEVPDSVGTANDDVWYSFIATSQQINIDVTDDFDGVIELFSGACGNLTSIEYDDYGGPSSNPTISRSDFVEGDTYYLRVYYYYSSVTTSPDFTVALWTTSALSTENFNQEAAFSYYPNPVNSNLTLSAQKAINHVSVYNMVGQEVYRNAPNTMINVVDMSGLQAGAYFVKVTVGNITETVKVIKN